MSDDEDTITAADVEVAPKKARSKRASAQKWGEEVLELGFVMVPSLLLWAQKRLKITPSQLAVIMHLAEHWWEAGRMPYPSKKRLADRMNMSERQVQRYIAELEDAGYVQRVQRYQLNKGKTSNEYVLTGLVERLKQLEPEFRKAKAEAESIRQQVRKPGLRRSKEAETD